MSEYVSKEDYIPPTTDNANHSEHGDICLTNSSVSLQQDARQDPSEVRSNRTDFEDEDDEDDGDTEKSGEVQLGFVEKSLNKLFDDPDWRNWDGGKVGGRPIWLNPNAIPTTEQLACCQCQAPMSFLLQIYCPLDDVQAAFHRALYIFCCKKRSCIDANSVKCFRSQLPRLNPFYAYEPNQDSDIQQDKHSSTTTMKLCELCGCHAPHVCSKCKLSHYCSRDHQREHWKYHKTFSCSLTNKEAKISNSDVGQDAVVHLNAVLQKALFPEYSLLVEDEELDDDDAELAKSIPLMDKAHIWDDAVTPGGEDETEDANLQQADYHKAAGNAPHDPQYIRFLTRVSRGAPDQVLRYCRAPNVTRSSEQQEITIKATHPASSKRKFEHRGMLYLSCDSKVASARSSSSLSPCEACGAARVFEFQIMPQLLYYLRVDQNTRLGVTDSAAKEVAKSGEQPSTAAISRDVFINSSEKDIDWGSLDIFTCSRSCGALDSGTSLVEEVVLQQPPVYISTPDAP